MFGHEIIRGERLSVRFGAVTALDSVSFAVAGGEVAALVGDNGAGKSTLAKLCAGAYRPSEGHLSVDGKRVELDSPRDAVRLGIATIYQDLALADNLSVTENVFLGCEATVRVCGIPILRKATMRDRVRALLSGLDAHIPDPNARLSGLSGGQRQAVAISRALNLEARLVIMDEPTAALAVGETRKVLALVRQLRGQGKAVILISHNIGEVFQVADRIIVLRRGRKVADVKPEATTPEEIIAFITGAPPEPARDRTIAIGRAAARHACNREDHRRMRHAPFLGRRGLASLLALVALATPSFADGKPKIAFVPQLIGIPYFNAIGGWRQESLCRVGGRFHLHRPRRRQPGRSAPDRQQPDRPGVGAISVSVLDASSLEPVMAAAKAKGIVIYTSDSDAPKSDRPVYVAQASDEGLGDAVIDELVKRVGADAKIGIVSGAATATNLNAWIGFMKARAAGKISEAEAARSAICRWLGRAGGADRDGPDHRQPRHQGADRRRVHDVSGRRAGDRIVGQDRQRRRHRLLQPEHRARLPEKWRVRVHRAVGSGRARLPDGVGRPAMLENRPFAASQTVPGMDHPVTFDAATGVLLLGPPAVFTKDNVDSFNF